MMTASGLNASAIPGGCIENKRLSEDEGVIFSWLLWTLGPRCCDLFQNWPCRREAGAKATCFRGVQVPLGILRNASSHPRIHVRDSGVDFGFDSPIFVPKS